MTLASFDWSSLAVEQNKRNVSKTKQTMKYIQGALRRRWATLVEAALALVGGLQNALRRRWATLVEAALALVGGLQKKKKTCISSLHAIRVIKETLWKSTIV